MAGSIFMVYLRSCGWWSAGSTKCIRSRRVALEGGNGTMPESFTLYMLMHKGIPVAKLTLDAASGATVSSSSERN